MSTFCQPSGSQKRKKKAQRDKELLKIKNKCSIINYFTVSSKSDLQSSK